MTTGMPDGSVVIPPAAVYNEVRDLTIVVRDLIARDAEDDRRRAREDQSRAEHDRKTDEKFKELFTRVNAIERKLYLWSGAAAAVGAGAGTYLPKLFGN